MAATSIFRVGGRNEGASTDPFLDPSLEGQLAERLPGLVGGPGGDDPALCWLSLSEAEIPAQRAPVRVEQCAPADSAVNVPLTRKKSNGGRSGNRVARVRD